MGDFKISNKPYSNRRRTCRHRARSCRGRRRGRVRRPRRRRPATRRRGPRRRRTPPPTSAGPRWTRGTPSSTTSATAKTSSSSFGANFGLRLLRLPSSKYQFKENLVSVSEVEDFNPNCLNQIDLTKFVNFLSDLVTCPSPAARRAVNG